MYILEVKTVQSSVMRILIEALKDILTDVNIILDESLVSLSPNPVSDFLQFELNNLKADNVEMRIVDMNGRVHFEQTLDVRSDISGSIDMSDMPIGIYMVQLQSEGESLVYKVVKQ